MERRDHPRMRGEHRDDHDVEHPDEGIIPACAGSTLVVVARACVIPDHPRMRGEHRDLGAVVVVAAGIIPACAGSTDVLRANPQDAVGSSPHARGAQTNKGAYGRTGRGSSPHARGALIVSLMPALSSGDHPRMRGEHGLHLRFCRTATGIIPACAGSTSIPTMSWPRRLGSSPHARGAHCISYC